MNYRRSDHSHWMLIAGVVLGLGLPLGCYVISSLLLPAPYPFSVEVLGGIRNPFFPNTLNARFWMVTLLAAGEVLVGFVLWGSHRQFVQGLLFGASAGFLLNVAAWWIIELQPMGGE